jgi:DNA polymerase IV (DinB-like DNA polymerase)
LAGGMAFGYGKYLTIGIKLVRSDFSIETREISFANYQKKRDSIVSVLGGLLDRFYFPDDNANKRTTTRLVVRKVGIKVSNLVRGEEKASPSKNVIRLFINLI